MAYDILIEKRAGTDTEAALMSSQLTALGLSGGIAGIATLLRVSGARSEEHTSELQSLEFTS